MARLRWLLTAIVLMSSTPVLAQSSTNEDEARAHFLLGRAHHEKGEFAEAAVQFERAYAISKKPALLYNVFLAYRDASDNARAADALRRYLAEAREVENRQQLEAKLAAMERAIAAEQEAAAAAAAAAAAQAQAEQAEPPQPAEPAPQAEAAPEPQPDEPPQPASEPTDEPQESSADFPVGPVIVIGVGGAMVIGSIVTGAMASAKQSKLEEDCPERVSCPASLEDTQNQGQTLALVTDVLLFGGIATAGAGVLWWLLGEDGEESSSASASGTPRAAVYCGPFACGANVRGVF